MTQTFSSILNTARRPLGKLAPAAVAMLAAGWAAAGCSTQQKVVYDPVNTKPIVGDDAMAFRADWQRNVAPYPSGDVVAWSTRFPYTDQETRFDQANLVLDTVLFVGQTAFLPVQLIANPPGDVQVWYGVKYPPTFTAQPPLPPKGGINAANAKQYSAR